MQASRQQQATARVELASLNNALWCDAVCGAHGVPGLVGPTVWWNPNLPPPFHSNLVVISSLVSQAEIDDHVRHLSTCALAPTWSIKDSFSNLDMARSGFGVLFDAWWIWLDAERPVEHAAPTSLRDCRIEAPRELAQWEAGWRDDDRNQAAAGRPRQFPDALLADPKIAFLALEHAGGIVAGGIAHRTPGVVGLSNVFVNDADRSAAWRELVGLARLTFPGFPIVGYLRGDDLDLAQALGFEAMAPLRVWIRNPRHDATPAQPGNASPPAAPVPQST